MFDIFIALHHRKIYRARALMRGVDCTYKDGAIKSKKEEYKGKNAQKL